jgi:lipopolysaccharide export system ATP-binding protein
MKLVSINLVKIYNKRRVVNNVSINIESSEIVGLLGPNGAGKSTTFNMLMGFIKPDEGKIFLDDKDITELPVYKRARLGIGYLAQEPTVFRELTVEENLIAVIERVEKDRRKIMERVDKLLKEFSLINLRKQYAYNLSGGEKRRLEVARVMINSPQIIMLDEPFVGIDPITVEELKKIIHYLKEKGVGILISDHNVRETLSVVDRAYLIYRGEILIEGDANTLANDPKARELYLGESFKLG